MQGIKIIGVAGGSGSGKSSLVRTASQELGVDVAVLGLDAYYLGAAQMPEWLEGNYDHPESLDLALFREHLRALRKGHAVEIPVYDFKEHRRTGYVPFSPQRLLILDGVLLYAIPRVLDSLDLSVYVQCSAQERLARRLARDRGEERDRSEAQTRRQFADTVQPMHAQFVAPYSEQVDLVIDTEAMDEQQAAAKLVAAIKPLLA